MRVLLIWILACSIGFAQRPTLTDEESVAQAVITEIEEVFQSADFIKKKERKFKGVSGYMVIDISVIQNGKVSTFFKAESDISDIDFINFMSDYILTHKFRFKLPKKQRYKIRHKLNFN
jgi:hypothetical protein